MKSDDRIMKKILIVDDDEDFSKSLSELLRTSGYHTTEASSCSKAIEKVSSEDFDIALVDVMMPEVDGLDTLRELKRLKPRIVVIMVTAFSTVENAIEAIKRGASDYITKPYKPDDLLSRIRRVIEEASFEESIEKLYLNNTLNSLSSPIRRKIIGLLYSNINMRLKDITRELTIVDHTRVNFHLKVLKKEGMVKQDEGKLYSLTKEGERAIKCLKLIGNFFSD